MFCRWVGTCGSSEPGSAWNRKDEAVACEVVNRCASEVDFLVACDVLYLLRKAILAGSVEVGGRSNLFRFDGHRRVLRRTSTEGLKLRGALTNVHMLAEMRMIWRQRNHAQQTE